MAGLLFLAFAYFAVGQAAVNRSGAQTAADAAALAGAQETRDQLAGLWVEDVLDPTKWQAIFDGVGADGDPCGRASELAAQNYASLDRCKSDGLRFKVAVQTNKSAGDSVIPATSTTKAHAWATAVIDPLCTFESPSESPSEPSEPPAEPSGPPSGEDLEANVLPTLTCKGGRNWELDPDDPAGLPRPEDLFDVHLVND
ncbi:pilus assembly protein TadG-related protein [Streptomyces sp. NPDC050121]|uniref:pilus assembly protein TadG-related protein n=1 Tax=Streptomyces sp. NPDC050121 TaxID=3365601 RepID=UPI0037B73BC1